MTDKISVHGVKSLVAVMKSDQTISLLTEYCSTASGINAEILKSDDPLGNAQKLVNGGADIVIVEAGLIDDAGINVLEQLCAYVTQGGSFIAIADEPPISVIRRLFQAGVTDVLPAPVVEQEFITALDTAAAAQPRRPEPARGARRNGVILTVLKTTGGVGATTVAVNLATEIKRQFDTTVALADLDLQFGNMHLALDLQPKMSVIEAIRAGDRLDTTLLRSTLMKHKSGVDLLASAPEITPLEAINDEFITACFEKFRQSFDVTIVETPTCWTDWTRTVLAQSDLIVPVLEPNARSGAGAARVMQCFHELDLISPPLFTVVNKVEKSIATSDRIERLKEIMGRKADMVISKDSASAAEAFDCGAPIRSIFAKSPAAKDISKMAAKIVSRLGLEPDVLAPATEKKGFSLKALRSRGE